MEKIIHFVITHSQSHEVKNNIEAARSLHPDWEIKVWDSVPEGKDFYLCNHYKLASSPGVLKNMIALDVIHFHGGVFLDDNICLVKSVDFLTTRDHFFISDHGDLVSTAFFGAKKASPIIRFLLEELTKKTAWSEMLSETATGPDFFSSALRGYPDIFMLPASMLVPGTNRSVPKARSHLTLGVVNPKRLINQRKRYYGFVKTISFLSAGVKRCINSPKELLRRLFARLFNYMFYIGEKTTKVHYPFGSDIITRMNNGLSISLPGNDLSIVPCIVIDGNYWEKELSFVEKHLSGGDFFIDVGCNVGIYTLVAAKKVGPFGRVFAFDPNPSVITHLKRSLFMNYFHDRVKIFNVAVGDRNQPAAIHFSENDLGGASMGLDERSFHARTLQILGNTTSIEVPQVTLDDTMDAGIEIKCMKIDVEGFEHKVIAGAKRLIISRAVQYIILELIDYLDFNEYHKNLEAIQFIQSCGYSLHKLSINGRLEPVADLRQRRNDGNFILVRSV